MRTVTLKKDQLLAKVKENRTKHEAEYKEAAEGYRLLAIKEMRKNLKTAKKGGSIVTRIDLEKPINNLEDYDRVISMLEFGIDDTVELDQHEYDQYVLDKWHWRAAASATNSFYAASVGSAKRK